MYSGPCLCEVGVGCLLLLGTCVQFLDVIAVYTQCVGWSSCYSTRVPLLWCNMKRCFNCHILLQWSVQKTAAPSMCVYCTILVCI